MLKVSPYGRWILVTCFIFCFNIIVPLYSRLSDRHGDKVILDRCYIITQLRQERGWNETIFTHFITSVFDCCSHDYERRSVPKFGIIKIKYKRHKHNKIRNSFILHV